MVAAAVELGSRILGAVAVDPLDVAETDSWGQLETNLRQAVLPADRVRHEEILGVPDEEATVQLVNEQLALLWPAYFPDPSSAPPVPWYWRMDAASFRSGNEAMQSTALCQPALAEALRTVEVPFTFLHCMAGPMPVIASSASVAVMPDVQLELLDDAGHFPW